MRLNIHRGTREIGASCVVVEHGSTRILLDAGIPLDDSEAILPENIDQFDGVFISHGHQDHYGLVERLPANVPVFMGKVAWAFMQSLRVFTSRLLLPGEIFRPLRAGEEVVVGDISVTPLLVDHSSPEAFGLLVEAGGEAFYYTGDFRNHGRKGWTLDALCERLPDKLDAVVLEGTMLRRGNAEFPSEDSVEQGMVDAVGHTQGLVCLCCSAQNIDRMVTAYRVAKRCGRTLVVDIYTAWILRVAQRLSKNIPDIMWDGVRVLSRGRMASGQYAKLKTHPNFFGDFARDLYLPQNELRAEDVTASPSRYLLKLGDHWLNDFLDSLGGKGTVIYSQWAGYLAPGTRHCNARAASLKERDGVTFKHIHTSGHAPLEVLQDFVRRTSPRVVIPIHTESKHEYWGRFPKVRILDDGEEYVLSGG